MKLLFTSLTVLFSLSALADCTDLETARKACAEKVLAQGISVDGMSVVIDSQSLHLNVHRITRRGHAPVTDCVYTYDETVFWPSGTSDFVKIVGRTALHDVTCEFTSNSATNVDKY